MTVLRRIFHAAPFQVCQVGRVRLNRLFPLAGAFGGIMKTVKVEVLAGVLAIVAGLALPIAAEAGSTGPDSKHETKFQKLDTNKDGVISADERKVGQDARFKEKDTNNDGVISKDEATAAAQKKAAEMVDRMFEKADTNKDGKISREEFDAAGDKMRERHEHKADKSRDSVKSDASLGKHE